MQLTDKQIEKIRYHNEEINRILASAEQPVKPQTDKKKQYDKMGVRAIERMKFHMFKKKL